MRLERWLLLAGVVLAAGALAAPKRGAVPKRRAVKPAYVSVAPVVDRSATAGLPDEARRALDAELGRWVVSIAPAGETPSQADAVLRARSAVGLELALTIGLAEGGRVDASLLVSTYPGRALVGDYKASGAGASPHELVAPLAARLVTDLATSEGWARRTP